MAVHVLDEAQRCLQCKNPQCRKGCPIGTNIPEMIRLLKEKEILEAAYMLFANNPLSMICSLVNKHKKQCEGHCILGKKGAPIHISAIENYISDSCFERLKLERKPSNGMKAAVIGAGPAGITISIILAMRGYKITVFDSRDKIGGVMRYGIPEFRLPKRNLERYQDKMRELGILFRPNFQIGSYITIQDLLDDGYKAVFIGTGAWRPRRMKIPGETFGNVQYAINYLNNPEVYKLGNDVAIIGAGNAAMDVARTAIRHGSKHVTVFVRAERALASRREMQYAQIDGVHFEYHQTAKEITDEGVIICDTEGTEDEGVTLKEETARLFPASTVIIAISQTPQDNLIRRDSALTLNQSGTLKTNEMGETTMKGVFASGDVVTGAKTVVSAVRYSKEIADDMDNYMRSLQ